MHKVSRTAYTLGLSERVSCELRGQQERAASITRGRHHAPSVASLFFTHLSLTPGHKLVQPIICKHEMLTSTRYHPLPPLKNRAGNRSNTQSIAGALAIRKNPNGAGVRPRLLSEVCTFVRIKETFATPASTTIYLDSPSNRARFTYYNH